jgi:hypothetical protein
MELKEPTDTCLREALADGRESDGVEGAVPVVSSCIEEDVPVIPGVLLWVRRISPGDKVKCIPFDRDNWSRNVFLPF